MSTPLAVLDLVPVSSGSTVAQALANSADLAESAERLGYARYWVAEHHLNPGVAGVSPAVVLALVAARTRSIRLGSAALQTGHRTVLSAVEDFALLDAVHPGRVDLGIGRPGGPPRAPDGSLPAPPPAPTPEQAEGAVVDGLRIPGPFPLAPLLTSPRFAAVPSLVPAPGPGAPPFAEQVDTVLALLAGTFTSPSGVALQAHPGTRADLQVWLFGSTGGTTAAVAGERGLRFGANYHVAPQGVLDAARAYRAAFRPSDHPAGLQQPHLVVSADVVVAETEEEAEHLAAGYGPWVRSIRTAAGAIPYPSPPEAAEMTSAGCWTADDDALVRDRLATRFVGTATTVTEGLERLRDATGADELLVTTTTHDHAARVRSYELLAAAWGGPVTAPDAPGGSDGLDQLDRAVWNALHGPHAALAVRRGRVVAYPADVSPFASLPQDPTPADWEDAAALALAGAGALLLTGDVPAPPPGWSVLVDLPGVQMVATAAVASEPFGEATPLDLDDPADVADALALVELAQPGPFAARTMAMGAYLGVRREGRLVAMAGERLHPEGAVEISAVCTDPAWQGQGLGTRMVRAAVHGVRERGEVPFLHAAASNTGAIRLYEHLGFALRRTTRFTALRPPAPTGAPAAPPEGV